MKPSNQLTLTCTLYILGALSIAQLESTAIVSGIIISLIAMYFMLTLSNKIDAYRIRIFKLETNFITANHMLATKVEELRIKTLQYKSAIGMTNMQDEMLKEDMSLVNQQKQYIKELEEKNIVANKRIATLQQQLTIIAQHLM